MDRERIANLITLLRQSRATEIDVREGNVRVRIVRSALPTGRREPEEAGQEQAQAARQGILVHSRVVGFFRRSEETTGRVFAEPGQIVDKGQPLARIETLGKSVVVEAPTRAKVVEFLAEDGQSVEYATPLVRLQPAE
ncbi:MAG: hypothetical protein H5T86_10840 [Armatimonadetes bacterium]|nr:hypothetical protein [Armatimonadota bacterium]